MEYCVSVDMVASIVIIEGLCSNTIDNCNMFFYDQLARAKQPKQLEPYWC